MTQTRLQLRLSFNDVEDCRIFFLFLNLKSIFQAGYYLLLLK